PAAPVPAHPAARSPPRLARDAPGGTPCAPALTAPPPGPRHRKVRQWRTSAETSASSRRDADEFPIARQELGFPLRFPPETRPCGARPGFERLESPGIASQGIDRSRDVIGAIGIEQGPSPRLLH